MAQRNICQNCNIMYVNAGPGQWCLACDIELADAPEPSAVTIRRGTLTVSPPVSPSELTKLQRGVLNLLIDEVYGTRES